MYGSIVVVMNEFNIVLNLLLVSSSESWREVTPDCWRWLLALLTAGAADCWRRLQIAGADGWRCRVLALRP